MSQHVEHSDAILAYSGRSTVEEPDRLPTFQGWSLAVAIAFVMWAGIGLGAALLYNAFHG